MGVSANTLFHFTEKEKFIGILKNQFHPKYSLEDLSNVIPDSKIYAAHIPMVCFCDLLFSQIKYHIDFYGDYGIGLQKKGWGIENGISPIFYVPKDAISATLLQSITGEIASIIKDKGDLGVIQKQLPDFYKYLKIYDGISLNRKTRKMEYRIFYDEREWRYVPMNFQVLEEKHANEPFVKKENLKMEKAEKLTFKAKDVKYIIVKNESEIPEFADFIDGKQLQKHFTKDERKLLISKLISVEQIRDDM